MSLKNIIEWFDPYNDVHIDAWVQLGKTGMWPHDFIPHGMGFSNLWQVGLANKIANCWVEQQNSTGKLFHIEHDIIDLEEDIMQYGISPSEISERLINIVEKLSEQQTY